MGLKLVAAQEEREWREQCMCAFGIGTDGSETNRLSGSELAL